MLYSMKTTEKQTLRCFMKHGRTITLFLLDGSVTGAIKYTLPNWTGVVYKIPRTSLSSCKDRAHLQQSGVYFLFDSF